MASVSTGRHAGCRMDVRTGWPGPLMLALLVFAEGAQGALPTIAWPLQIVRPPGEYPASSIPTHVVTGVRRDGVDPSHAHFGTDVEILAGRLWIGSPGYSGGEAGSGAVWLHVPPGWGGESVEQPLLPVAPLPGTGFGAATAVEPYKSAYVAIVSKPSDLAAGGMRLGFYYAPSPDLWSMETTLPEIGTIWNVDVALTETTIAVTRYASGGADVLIYEPDFALNQLALKQTIALPTQMTWPPAGYGRNVEIYTDWDRYQWLVAGPRVYQRWSDEAFTQTGTLSAPLTSSHDFGIITRYIDTLVMSGALDFPVIGFRFPFDSDHGWSAGHALAGLNGYPYVGDCLALALFESRFACLVVGANGPEILLARPQPEGGWKVIGTARVPGPASGWNSPFSMAMWDDYVVIGWPETGDENGIVNAGQVVVMVLYDQVFASGFD